MSMETGAVSGGLAGEKVSYLPLVYGDLHYGS